MRWKDTDTPDPRAGERRVVSRFLLLPHCVAHEWRWLERGYIEQRCGYYCGWYDIAWTDRFAFNRYLDSLCPPPPPPPLPAPVGICEALDAATPAEMREFRKTIKRAGSKSRKLAAQRRAK